MARAEQPELHLRITVVDPVPGVWLRLQSGRAELIEPVVETASEVSFDFTVRVGPPQPDGSPNFLGPCTQGSASERFVYVTAGTRAGQPGTAWNRRAKIPLRGISSKQISAALKEPGTIIEVRYPGRAKDGGPTCASVRLPPDAWVLRRRKAGPR